MKLPSTAVSKAQLLVELAEIWRELLPEYVHVPEVPGQTRLAPSIGVNVLTGKARPLAEPLTNLVFFSTVAAVAVSGLFLLARAEGAEPALALALLKIPYAPAMAMAR